MKKINVNKEKNNIFIIEYFIYNIIKIYYPLY